MSQQTTSVSPRPFAPSAESRLTRSDHPSGTDRLAEIASADVADLYVNIQGDEPLIDPEAVDAAALSVLGDESVAMGTLKKRIIDPAEIVNPNVVKVVTALNGDAIYFSRNPIPHIREGDGDGSAYFKHVGLYVYRRDFLLLYPDLSIGPLERAERLEQLRALESGYRIRVVETDYESFGVDTPEDLQRVEQAFLPDRKPCGAAVSHTSRWSRSVPQEHTIISYIRREANA